MTNGDGMRGIIFPWHSKSKGKHLSSALASSRGDRGGQLRLQLKDGASLAFASWADGTTVLSRRRPSQKQTSWDLCQLRRQALFSWSQEPYELFFLWKINPLNVPSG